MVDLSKIVSTTDEWEVLTNIREGRPLENNEGLLAMLEYLLGQDLITPYNMGFPQLTSKGHALYDTVSEAPPEHPALGVRSVLVGARNRAAIRVALVTNPGIKGTEIAERLGLDRRTVQKHIRAIRQEWAE